MDETWQEIVKSMAPLANDIRKNNRTKIARQMANTPMNQRLISSSDTAPAQAKTTETNKNDGMNEINWLPYSIRLWHRSEELRSFIYGSSTSNCTKTFTIFFIFLFQRFYLAHHVISHSTVSSLAIAFQSRSDQSSPFFVRGSYSFLSFVLLLFLLCDL